MKITKTHLARIVQEEVAKSIKEGMMDAIKDKLSPKRPAKAPYQKSENDKEARYLMGVEDAKDAMHISGDYRESPSSDDEDYMAGWNDTIQGANSAMQEGKNKIIFKLLEERRPSLNFSDSDGVFTTRNPLSQVSVVHIDENGEIIKDCIHVVPSGERKA